MSQGARRRLPEQIADDLQKEILSLQGRSNDRLPTEVELGQRYDVSRTVIREAVKLLAQRGLVTVTPGRGTVVAQYDGRFIADQFALLMEAKRGRFADLLELRLALEVQIATRVAQHGAEDWLERLEQTLTDGKAALQNREAFLDSDMQFHELLAEACGNPYVELVSLPINRFLRKHYHKRTTYPSDPERTLEEHQEILEAIRKRDTLAARSTMEQHLRRLLRTRGVVDGEAH